ncbi:hypothetical protein OAN307_c03910 [Octadecabacter antarcticus 307]|uniref:Uncharacterized protein n=1 Tax=Octadecabacter antarcticus 307 TaxID=391626 RepID=M9R1L8_9RHOB|nr:hypothetical protein OAN307_c03910 [Octadecabacter antarcticus 307]
MVILGSYSNTLNLPTLAAMQNTVFVGRHLRPYERPNAGIRPITLFVLVFFTPPNGTQPQNPSNYYLRTLTPRGFDHRSNPFPLLFVTTHNLP